MSTKKVQEGIDPATPEAKVVPPSTTTVQQPETNSSAQVASPPSTSTTGSTATQGGTGSSTPSRPPRPNIPGYYPNPNGRFEVLYNQTASKTPEEKKATFLEIRALITGEGDKIQVSGNQKSRKWTFGRLSPPSF